MRVSNTNLVFNMTVAQYQLKQIYISQLVEEITIAAEFEYDSLSQDI